MCTRGYSGIEGHENFLEQFLGSWKISVQFVAPSKFSAIYIGSLGSFKGLEMGLRFLGFRNGAMKYLGLTLGDTKPFCGFKKSTLLYTLINGQSLVIQVKGFS